MRRSTQLPKMENLPPPKKKIDQAKEALERATDFSSDGAVGALILHHAITVAILASLIAIGGWSYLTFSQTEFFASVDRAEHGARLEPYLVAAQKQRISSALEVAYRLDNRYPVALEGLVEAGLLLPADLFYPAGRDRWEYRRHDQHFDLYFSKPEPSNRDDQ